MSKRFLPVALVVVASLSVTGNHCHQSPPLPPDYFKVTAQIVGLPEQQNVFCGVLNVAVTLTPAPVGTSNGPGKWGFTALFPKTAVPVTIKGATVQCGGSNGGHTYSLQSCSASCTITKPADTTVVMTYKE